jgi:hypothetical protein
MSALVMTMSRSAEARNRFSALMVAAKNDNPRHAVPLLEGLKRQRHYLPHGFDR